MAEKFNPQEYRDNLAEKIKQEQDKEKRMEISEEAKTTDDYMDALAEHEKRELDSIPLSEAEKSFPYLFRPIKQAYPEYASRLKDVSFYTRDFRRPCSAIYDILDHAITFKPDFASKEETANQNIEATKDAMHEFIHAISYRRVKRLEGQGNYDLDSGISHSLINNGKGYTERELTNEVITNYFTYKILTDVIGHPGAKELIKKYRDKDNDWIAGEAIAKLVGEDLLRNSPG